MIKIHFLGAARQVTGSRYLLEAGGLRILIDCGMFQERAFLERNWQTSPIPADDIDAVLLTHAHLDHSGLLPRLVGEGYRGPIYCTAATADLARIILEDAAEIQEEDAAYKAKRHRKQGHKGRHPVVPLYRTEQVTDTLPLFKTVAYDETLHLNDHVRVCYREAGHILGSAMLEIEVPTAQGPRMVVFSGDIGQWNKPIIRDPSLLKRADVVVMESTYGDRDHPPTPDIPGQLAQLINETVEAGGNLLIPTFAVERAQELMYHIGRLVRERAIPPMLIFLDSPMAVDVTDVFRRHRAIMDTDTRELIESGEPPLRFPGLRLVRSRAESKGINTIHGTCIIMASSGMCTAGRIKHHLARHVGRPQSTVVFVGYQARGTLGHELSRGKEVVRIHGKEHRVRCRIAHLQGLSAHAGRADLLRWVGHFDPAPQRVFLTHGEEEGATELAARIHQELGVTVDVPEYRSTFALFE